MTLREANVEAAGQPCLDDWVHDKSCWLVVVRPDVPLEAALGALTVSHPLTAQCQTR